MHFEITGVKQLVTVDDKGIKMTSLNGNAKWNRFVPFSKLVSVTVGKPSFLKVGYIFFRTVADGNYYLNSLNTALFKGKENYEIALQIQAALEDILADS